MITIDCRKFNDVERLSNALARAREFKPPAALVLTQEQIERVSGRESFEIVDGFAYLGRVPLTLDAAAEVPPRAVPPPPEPPPEPVDTRTPAEIDRDELSDGARRYIDRRITQALKNAGIVLP